MIALLGKYLLLMGQVFRKPEKFSMFWEQLMNEFQKIGVESLGIVIVLSTFMGAVAAMQVAFNIDSPLIPLITVGFTVRQSIILEFSPTVISLILAGKVGSRIASEIGTMRVTEQIDALQIMGVNSANYLILPKLVAALLFNPVLIIVSMLVGLVGA
jgi:phospholipid/cholesterol/gamma-HCH transport system permease protein